jgi:hypothetical protein
MPWVRFDDRFPTHRKVRRLSDAAFRLHVSAIHWCAEHLTDGHVPADELDLVSDVRDPKAAVAELEPKLWEPLEDGWLIHDFLEYQPSAAEVRSTRAKRADAGRLGGKRSAEARRSKPEANASANGEAEAQANGNPGPARPVPEERGAPPSTRCPTHVDNPTPPPCGRCKEARIARERWDTDQSKRDREATLVARRCGLCDADGWRLTPGSRIPLSPYERCDHRPLRSVSVS